MHILNIHTHFCLKTGAKSLLIRHSATSLRLALCLLQQAKLCSYCIPDAKKQIRQNKNEDTAHVPAKKAWEGGRSMSFLKTLGFLRFANNVNKNSNRALGKRGERGKNWLESSWRIQGIRGNAEILSAAEILEGLWVTDWLLILINPSLQTPVQNSKFPGKDIWLVQFGSGVYP